MNKGVLFKGMKVGGAIMGIVGGLLVAAGDIPDVSDAIGEFKERKALADSQEESED